MKQSREMIRTFLALNIPDAAKDWIEERKRELARSMRGSVRWVKREGLHITLHFFGEISRENVERVEEILSPRVRMFPAFALSVRGIGAFPSLGKPRVLWAGVEESNGRGRLKDLHATLRDALANEGFPVESRLFSAHVTMGRVKKSLQVAWENFLDLPPGPQFSVHEVILFQSTLTPRGAIYQPIKHLPLGGRQNGKSS